MGLQKLLGLNGKTTEEIHQLKGKELEDEVNQVLDAGVQAILNLKLT